MTSHQALTHAFIVEPTSYSPADAADSETGGAAPDLLPTIKKNFNARRTLHAAIDTIRAINKLREGGAAGLMDGAFSGDPRREESGRTEGNGNGDGDGNGKGGVDGRGDEMEIDSRGNARGQTEQMIWAQERKVQETARGLWSGVR